MQKTILSFCLALALCACNPKTEAELEQTSPTVLYTNEALGPLYRRMATLSRDCKDAASFLATYTTDAEYFEAEGFAEITFRGRDMYGSAPLSKVVLRDLGNRREIKIFDVLKDTGRLAEWARGKATCR